MADAPSAPGRLRIALRERVLRMPFPLYFAAHHLDGRIDARRVSAAGRDRAFRPLSALDLSRHRTSSTLFILGSGSSINRMTDEQWQLIRAHDSMGVSFWPLHEFVPTYLCLEGPPPDRAAALYGLLHARADEYRNVPIIAKGGAQRFEKDRFPPELRGNLYYSRQMIVPARDEAEFRRSLRWLKALRLLDPLRELDEVPMTRSSLTYTLFIAVAMGYRTIVLCGIDLKSTGYFYSEEGASVKHPELVPHTGQAGRVHLTFDPVQHPLTIDRIVRAVRDEVFAPAGAQLYIGSRESALYPELPFFFESADAMADASGRA
jgi:hypothetical protein